MASVRIVPALDELKDSELCLGMRAKGGPIDQLTFECREEALTHRIVEAIADRVNAGLLAASLDRDRCVLSTLVRMMDDISRSPLLQSHVQRVEHELGAQMICHRPADDSPSARI